MTDAISRQAVLDKMKERDEELSCICPKDIRCLPPVTPKPCEDCISRQAVNELVDELARAISDERCCISRGRSTATIMRDILHLPLVTPQQKMGRWITWKEAGNDIPSETRFECSVCHDAAQTLCNGLDLLSTYCPNCGAKMQEVEE